MRSLLPSATPHGIITEGFLSICTACLVGRGVIDINGAGREGGLMGTGWVGSGTD